MKVIIIIIMIITLYTLKVFFSCATFKVLISLRSCTEEGLGTKGKAKVSLRAMGWLHGFTLPHRTHSSPTTQKLQPLRSVAGSMWAPLQLVLLARKKILKNSELRYKHELSVAWLQGSRQAPHKHWYEFAKKWPITRQIEPFYTYRPSPTDTTDPLCVALPPQWLPLE